MTRFICADIDVTMLQVFKATLQTPLNAKRVTAIAKAYASGRYVPPPTIALLTDLSLADNDYHIIGGRHRIAAASVAGLTSLQCLVLDEYVDVSSVVLDNTTRNMSGYEKAMNDLSVLIAQGHSPADVGELLEGSKVSNRPILAAAWMLTHKKELVGYDKHPQALFGVVKRYVKSHGEQPSDEHVAALNTFSTSTAQPSWGTFNLE
jgi:hypothetical protein